MGYVPVIPFQTTWLVYAYDGILPSTPMEINPTSNDVSIRKRLARWFFISGIVGVLVEPIVLAFEALNVAPGFFLLLWPSVIFGFANPSEWWKKFLIDSIVFGGNFVLYGTVGSSLALCVHLFVAPNGPKSIGEVLRK